MKEIWITNARCIFPDGIKEKTVVVKDGQIFDFPDDICPPPEAVVVDAQGKYLSPGFIDTHTHGAGGCDYMDGSCEAMITAAKTQLKHGATTIVPTPLAAAQEEILHTLRVYQTVKQSMKDGPHLAGLHLEGPYFAMSQRGAQPPQYIRVPKAEEYMEIMELAAGDIRIWSLAPELDGAMELIKVCQRSGIRTSVGHSDAAYETVQQAYELGCKRITHLYSACSTITRVNGYRRLGVVESAFLLKDMYVELIADGCHLPPALIRLVYDAKGADRICLVTDSMRAAGTDATTSVLGSLQNGTEIIIEDGVAKMPSRECFAGSIATCDRLVRVAWKQAKIPLHEAVKMAATTPAASVGLADKTGSIALGKAADLILFDEDINVSWHMVGGNIIEC